MASDGIAVAILPEPLRFGNGLPSKGEELRIGQTLGVGGGVRLLDTALLPLGAFLKVAFQKERNGRCETSFQEIKRGGCMRCLVRITAVTLTVAMLATVAEAMDTKAAGKCVVLGALSTDYESKAKIILATADAQGYTTLVKQQAHEEFAYLARNDHDETAKKGWVVQAVRACDQF